MITNILLGLILGIILSSYIIINKKVTQIQSNTEYILTKLRGIDGVNSNNNKLISILLDKLNNFILGYNGLNTLLENKVDRNTEHFDKKLSDITTLIYDVNEHINVQHNNTRNEIKKQAKISSKINSKTKTSKSINK